MTIRDLYQRRQELLHQMMEIPANTLTRENPVWMEWWEVRKQLSQIARKK